MPLLPLLAAARIHSSVPLSSRAVQRRPRHASRQSGSRCCRCCCIMSPLTLSGLSVVPQAAPPRENPPPRCVSLSFVAVLSLCWPALQRNRHVLAVRLLAAQPPKCCLVGELSPGCGGTAILVADRFEFGYRVSSWCTIFAYSDRRTQGRASR